MSSLVCIELLASWLILFGSPTISLKVFCGIISSESRGLIRGFVDHWRRDVYFKEARNLRKMGSKQNRVESGKGAGKTFQASNLLLYRPVCIRPGRKHRRPDFFSRPAQ